MVGEGVPFPSKKGVIDLQNPYKGRVGDDAMAEKYKGKKLGFNGDYRVPKDFQDAIEKAGRALIKYAEDKGVDLVSMGFDINKDGKVGHFEAGSGVTALTMEHGRRDVAGKGTEEIASVFNDGSFILKKPLTGENWRIAEQILGDNWPHMVPKPTNTEEADKSFVRQYKNSGNEGLMGGGKTRDDGGSGRFG